MEWREWQNKWDFIEFINNPERRRLANGKFEEFDRTIEDARQRGYDVVHLRKLGTLRNTCNIPILYEASKEAYKCGNGSIAVSRIWIILAKKLDITDKNDMMIWECENGTHFIIKYISGDPSRLGWIELVSPEL